MNSDDKKLIVFESDISFLDKDLNKKRYIKFLEEDKLAMFYSPLIGPRDLKNHLVENNILVGYEITNEQGLRNYQDKIYTFRKDNGVYLVTKGIELDKKRILLVDKGMDLEIDLPKYLYEVKDASFYLSPINEEVLFRSYCYVANEDEVTPELKKIMLPVIEAVPGILSINTYPFVPSDDVKRLKNKLT